MFSGRIATAMLACSLVLAGCAGARPGADSDGGAADAGAAPDARPARPERSARDVTSGGGRLRGGGLTMDVQVGHAHGQEPMRSGSQTVDPGAAVKP